MDQDKAKCRLRIRRVTLGLTQEELARKSGVDHTRISRIERGYGRPSAREYEALALALGMSPQRLFSDKEGRNAI